MIRKRVMLSKLPTKSNSLDYIFSNKKKTKKNTLKPLWVTKYNPIFGVYVSTGLRQSWTEKQTRCLQTQS